VSIAVRNLEGVVMGTQQSAVVQAHTVNPIDLGSLVVAQKTSTRIDL
jgi:hypothetical protein